MVIEYKKHPDYDILCSNEGKVYNLDKTPLVCSEKVKYGLRVLYIPAKNRPDKSSIHIRSLQVLIFEAFNYKVNGKLEIVKHIDGNKNNNIPENLTVLQKGFVRGQDSKIKNPKLICSYDPKTDELEWHRGIGKTANEIGKAQSGIYKAIIFGHKCDGKRWFYGYEALECIKELKKELSNDRI